MYISIPPAPTRTIQQTVVQKLERWDLKNEDYTIPYSTLCLDVGNKGEEKVQDDFEGPSLNDQTGRM